MVGPVRHPEALDIVVTVIVKVLVALVERGRVYLFLGDLDRGLR